MRRLPATSLSALRRISRALEDVAEPGGHPIGVRLACLPRMARAVARGEYTEVSAGHLALLGVAAAYVVSPVDLLPEALVGVVGLADDAVVLAWLAQAVNTDTDRFLAWEKARRGTVEGQRLA